MAREDREPGQASSGADEIVRTLVDAGVELCIAGDGFDMRPRRRLLRKQVPGAARCADLA